jgi:hypothetical protein
MKLAVIGSRSFSDQKMLTDILNQLENISCIISGGARGADQLAEQWAHDNQIKTKIFLPNWDQHGKQAGILRNIQIIENADACIAFWDGKSKGTKHSISLCKKYGKMCTIININKSSMFE